LWYKVEDKLRLEVKEEGTFEYHWHRCYVTSYLMDFIELMKSHDLHRIEWIVPPVVLADARQMLTVIYPKW
jgi:hypothetical protein